MIELNKEAKPFNPVLELFDKSLHKFVKDSYPVGTKAWCSNPDTIPHYDGVVYVGIVSWYNFITGLKAEGWVFTSNIYHLLPQGMYVYAKGDVHLFVTNVNAQIQAMKMANDVVKMMGLAGTEENKILAANIHMAIQLNKRPEKVMLPFAKSQYFWEAVPVPEEPGLPPPAVEGFQWVNPFNIVADQQENNEQQL